MKGGVLVLHSDMKPGNLCTDTLDSSRMCSFYIITRQKYGLHVASTSFRQLHCIIISVSFSCATSA